jgi:hypothetical protein
MKWPAVFFILFLVSPGITRADDARSRSTDTTLTRPVIAADRLRTPISIDGILSEPEWQRAGITRFTQKDPNEGADPSQRTEVWVTYDDAALYVAARLYDTHPDSIVSRIGRRDANLSSDWFYVGIDSYHDRRSGFYFGVYAGGTMSDGTMFNDDWDDNTWDGVWDAATKIDEQGWTVEMRIPYSQLRFPKQDEYTWGINFIRTIARNQERDDFVLVPRKESGWVSRFADLTGLRNIAPPRKLEILPYLVSSGKFLQHVSGDPFVHGHDFSQNVGGDLKLGLGSNLTLSATINPDFGQVEVDPAVVNLTQFETFFDEKRPFFVESSNLFDFGYGGANNNWGFNFGNPNFFYSRRIGRPPQGSVQHYDTDGEGDIFAEMPDHTHIIGAAKLTGKISEGWSVAALQAFTAREYGKTDSAGTRFADVVEPFTSYSVLRSMREFNQGRQGLGLITTAAVRDLNRDYLQPSYNSGAYALGIDGWTMLDSAQTWVVTGWLSATRVNGSTDAITNLQEGSLHYYQRPDIDYVSLDPSATSLGGYGGRLALNKQKGSTYLNAAIGVITPGFETSDLGFMFRTDVINSHLVLGYRWFDPDGVFRRKSVNLAAFRNYDFGGRKTGEGYFLFYNAEFMNYWGLNGTFSFNPATLDTRNTRGGPAMMNTNGYVFNLFGYSDSRSSVVYNFGIGGGRTESGGYQISIDPGITWKPTAGVTLSITPDLTRDITIAQWVMRTPDQAATATYGNRYLFAKLDYRELSSSIRVDWTFTPKLTLQLYFQPLFSFGTYSEFKELRQPGTYTFNRYGTIDSSIFVADRDMRLALDPRNPADTTVVHQGDYVADPDGTSGTAAKRFTFSNPNFNLLSLRGNAILRWEFLPGSTLFFVWTHQRTGAGTAGSFDLASDLRNLMDVPGDNIFLVKMSYWWNP